MQQKKEQTNKQESYDQSGYSEELISLTKKLLEDMQDEQSKKVVWWF